MADGSSSSSVVVSSSPPPITITSPLPNPTIPAIPPSITTIPPLHTPISTDFLASSSKSKFSPYDVNPNDHPGLIITHVQFTGKNYDEWAKAIRFAFTAKQKLGFLDGIYPRPIEGTEDFEDWRAINSLIVTWVFNTIEKEQKSTISYRESVAVLWKDIRDRFHTPNGSRLQQLKSDLCDCKQRGKSISDYYGRLKKIWEELAECDAPPSCSCGRCSCDLSSAFDRRAETEKVHQFLLGLDESLYGTVRSQLLAVDPLPSVNRVYSTLIREEHMHAASRPKPEISDALSFNVAATPPQSRPRQDNKDPSRYCTHCKRTGHEVDSCFHLHGFPEWWPDPRRASNHGCGSLAGRGRGRGRTSSTQAHAAVTLDFSTTPPAGTPESHGLVGVTPAQWLVLKNILAAHDSSNSSNDLKMTGPHYQDGDWSG